MNSNRLMCCLEDSPASQLASQGNDRATQTSAGYGQSLPVSFAVFDQLTSSWKTSQGCLPLGTDGFSEQSSVTWPRAGTMRSGIAYERPTSVLRTDASACSSLPTPTARDWKDFGVRSYGRHSDTLPIVLGGIPNPRWIEWLMGFPIGWTE